MTTIVLGLRLVLAGVFITAGVGKLLDLAGSRRAVIDFGVPERAAGFVGVALPLAELCAAVALVFRPSARWGSLAALLLLVAFIVGIGRALARGEQPDCHCFGQIHSAPASRWTLVRNAALAALAGVIVGYGSGPAVDTWISARSAAVLVAIGTGLSAIAAAAYAWKLRDDVRRLRSDLGLAQQSAARGSRWGLEIGADAPNFALPDMLGQTVTLDTFLERGRPVLLAFMSPWCGPCASILPQIQQWQQTLSERLTIAVVSTGTVEQNEPLSEQGLADIVLQEEMEIAKMYYVRGTPTAVLVSPQGKIASTVGEMAQAIEPLIRMALRTWDPLAEGLVA